MEPTKFPQISRKDRLARLRQTDKFVEVQKLPRLTTEEKFQTYPLQSILAQSGDSSDCLRISSTSNYFIPLGYGESGRDSFLSTKSVTIASDPATEKTNLKIKKLLKFKPQLIARRKEARKFI